MARRIALVVGIDRYAHLPHLPAAAFDAQQIADVLAARGEFEVKRLKNPDHETLGRALTDMYGDQSLLSDDTLLLYFAGHGLASDDRDRFYLATTDTDPDYPDATAVGAEVIKSHLNNTFAKAKVILLDSCFSGLMGEGLRSRGDTRVGIKAPLDRKGTFVLTATDRTSYAYEDPRAEGTSALFTTAVIDALSGAAKDTDGDDWISVQDVAQFVLNAEEVTSRQKPLAFSNSVTGAIPLTRAETSAPTLPPTPVPAASARLPRPEPDDDPHAPLDGAAWQKLLRYYAACLRREAGLSGWFRKGELDRARLWRGGAERILTGPIGPVPLPKSITGLLDGSDDAAHFYGYPLALVKDGKQAKYAPLLVTELTITDGKAEAGIVELNTDVLEEWGLEAGEIDELARHFAKKFRPGQPEHLAELLRMIADTYGIPLIEGLEPERLSDDLRDSPIVEGIYNLGVVWRDDGSQSAVRNVINDLGKYAPAKVGEFDFTALAAFMSRDDRPVESKSMPQLVAPGPLNEAQEAVIDAAMTRRLTVATGPPGTGKTALVTALCATAEAAGQSVLVASTNHRAVDNVCEKLDPIAPGMIVRTGPKRLQEEEPGILTRLLASIESPPTDAGVLAGRLRTNEEHVNKLRAAIDARCEAEADLYAVHRHLDRIKPSPDTKASTVLDLDDRHLERTAAIARRSLRRWPIGIISRWLLRSRFGAETPAGRGHLLELVETEQLRRERLAALEKLPAAQPIWKDLQDRLAARNALSGDYSKVLTARRLRAGEAVIRTRIERMNRKEPGANWKGFRDLLKALPGWAVNGHSSTAIVPQPALFDLVIIDEAAQCATPYVLALLMRAKRALIIGDPNQIQPVIKLSKDVDEDLRRAAGLGAKWLHARHLGFVDESIYAACAAAAGEEMLLDEHYRCDPDIVAVPNHMVYQGRLTVLTARNRLKLPADPPGEPAVEIVDVPGAVQRPTNNRSWWNPVEAEQVVERTVKVLAENEHLTVGVVTPFKAQERLLDRLLRQRGIRDKVTVGTIHTFQGGECDVLLVSPVGADGIPPRSAGWVRGETNLWNVAITRAMSRLIVVCDRAWWTGRSGLLSSLVDSAGANFAAEPGDRDLTDSLQEALESAGLTTVKRDTTIAGQPCHLLIDGGSSRLAVFIDSTGAPDGRHHRQLLARLNLIQDAGYPTARIPAWRVLAEPASVVSDLAEMVQQV